MGASYNNLIADVFSECVSVCVDVASVVLDDGRESSLGVCFN
jgi:hypothetical protein